MKDKEQLFAQYWGLNVVIPNSENYWKGPEDNETIKPGKSWVCGDLSRFVETHKLLLKPLSQISDEDAKTLSLYLGGVVDSFQMVMTNSKELVKQVIDNYTKIDLIKFLPSAFIDKARSMGYAAPYLGHSIEKQIELGWIKLSEQ